ncbi:MAG TPA: GNAT family N-acetyltransferase [Caulobacteraceae bacterium]|nr:GNAT family N-acetyltransferase [Caulobacteraceae bacterium]
MSELGPTLETPRLVLRPLSGEDFDGWAELMADESSRFIGGPRSRVASWAGFAAVAGAWVVRGFSMFSVIEKASGRWVGRVGPWAPEGWPGMEVGWGLIKDSWGKGYATEAAAATMDWAFDALGWDDVIHIIDPENVRSQAVARRLGSENRGPGRMPEPMQDYRVDIWGQTREAWRARRR